MNHVPRRTLYLAPLLAFGCDAEEPQERVTHEVEPGAAVVADGDHPEPAPGPSPRGTADVRDLAPSAVVGMALEQMGTASLPADTAVVRGSQGITVMPFARRDGRAIVGDMDLGAADGIGEGTASLVELSPWPEATVRYKFSEVSGEALDASDRVKVRDAMDRIEERTVVRFVEHPTATSNDAYLLIQGWDEEFSQATTGYQGEEQYLWVGPGLSTNGMLHELGHTLGLWHSHQHPDREEHVSVDSTCIRFGRGGDFVIKSGPEFWAGEYDFRSMMHYDSRSMCNKDVDDLDQDGSTNDCVGITGGSGVNLNCLTVRNIDPDCPEDICEDRDMDPEAFPEYVDAQRIDYSPGDLEAIHRLYGPLVPSDGHPGDRFGHALATGDFNGDGYVDLAVGAPGRSEKEFGVLKAGFGKVYLYCGRRDGLFFCGRLTDDTFSSNPGPGHRLGASLAIGDLDADGVDDLLAGSPGYGDDAGRVLKYRGHTVRALSKSVSSVGYASPGDNLGHSVAIGNFTTTAQREFAVGAPWGPAGSDPHGGYVTVHSYTGGVIRTLHQEMVAEEPSGTGGGGIWIPQVLGTNDLYDAFGASLATGDINGDGLDDLVVGAPYDKVGAAWGSGGLYTFAGHAGLSAIRPWTSHSQSGLANPESWDGFGWSVAVGDLNADGFADVLAGAPFEDVADGGVTRVNTGWLFLLDGAVGGLTPWGTSSQRLSDTGDQDLFGTSISIDHDAVGGEFSVGAPGETWGSRPQAGATFLYRINGGSVAGVRALTQTGTGVDSDELGDDMGWAVARFTSNGDRYLAVGAPGEDGDRGAVYVFLQVEGIWNPVQSLRIPGPVPPDLAPLPE